MGNLKVNRDCDSNTFNNIWGSPDALIPTSQRGKYYVATQELLRGDVGIHIWQKWKSESEKVILVNGKREKVNLVNGEFGEYNEKT